MRYEQDNIFTGSSKSGSFSVSLGSGEEGCCKSRSLQKALTKKGTKDSESISGC